MNGALVIVAVVSVFKPVQMARIIVKDLLRGRAVSGLIEAEFCDLS